LELCSYLF